MKALCLTALIVVLSLLLAEALPPASAAPGDLDLTFGGFGTGGKVTGIPVKGAMALQPDGKIVVINQDGSSPRVLRYLPDGKPDSSFGEGGQITHHLFSGVALLYGVEIQADGKIVLAGWANHDFLLVRLTVTGALDTTFGGQGWLTTDFDTRSDGAYAVLIQPDGKIVVAGSSLLGNNDDFTDIAAARYNPNGSLDTAFGGNGKIIIDLGCGEWVSDIALQDDGKLVLVGATQCGDNDTDFAVVRLYSDGTRDNSFDGNGQLSTDFGGYEGASTVAIQPDGKIIAAGSVCVARYLSNGSLDDSFDGDGKLTISAGNETITDMALQPDGKILLLRKHTSSDSTFELALSRLNSNGSLDTTFDDDGHVYIDLSGDISAFVFVDGVNVALLPDGRIIVFGAVTGYNAVLMRFWPNGAIDDGGKETLGFPDTDFGPGVDESAHGVAVQPDGKIVVAGYITNADASQSNIALGRFMPDGQLDMSFGVHGRVTFPNFVISVASSVILQTDGKIVVAGYTRQGNVTNFLVVRFNNNGTLDTSFYLGFGYNVADFAGGDDIAYALALAPDGKIVVAGTAWNGARSVFGVARFNSNGHLDTTFNYNGKAYFDTLHSNWATAVVVQRDRKIVVGGHISNDFALVRFREDGLLDFGWGPGGQGWSVFDMGGTDVLRGLAITASGWFYAAGVRIVNGSGDFAVAQVMPNGLLATCSGFPCTNWSTGRAYVDWGGSEFAYAVDVRNDGQVLVGGSVGSQFGWAQFNPTTAASPLRGTTDFVSTGTIHAVQFAGANKLIAAGTQNFTTDSNFALARFDVRAFNQRFADVPTTHSAWQQIEAIFTNGITSGCQTNPQLYCPENIVTRAQMAIFLLRAKYGAAYQPPTASCVNGHTSNFTDVACPDLFANFIEQLRAEGITSGCGTNLYCPNAAVNRAQMAVFLLRTKYGSSYTPPAATGIFSDVPNDFFLPWIEQLAREGITLGCGPNVYCPNGAVTRAQMAVFLARTLNLPLP